MKRTLMVVSLLLLVGLMGCQQAQQSSVTKTLPDAAAQSNASFGSDLANSMCRSMAGWAQNGVSVFSVKGASIGSKSITGPDGNGYYHITETMSSGSYSYTYDVYGRVTPSTGTPTAVDLYGTVTVNVGSSYAYTFTYGSGASSPFHGAVTWTGTDVTNVSVNGTIKLVVTAPASTGSGTDTIELTMTTSSLSLPITSALDYPTGMVTIALKYNGAAQPDMTVNFGGTATASWTYGDTSGTFTVSPASL